MIEDHGQDRNEPGDDINTNDGNKHDQVNDDDNNNNNNNNSDDRNGERDSNSNSNNVRTMEM